MNESPVSGRLERCLDYLQRAGLVSDPSDPDTRRFVEALLEAMGERLKVYSDVLEFDEFLVDDDQLVYDEKAVNKRLRKDGVSGWLSAFRGELAGVETFEAGVLEELMKGWVERKELKLGQIIHAVRVAVTGKQAGIGMFEALELLGRESVLARIDRALELCEAPADAEGAGS